MSLKLECKSSSTIKRLDGEKNGKLVTSYQCEVCPRVFNKRQAFKNHRFMHKKRERKKSLKNKFLHNPSFLAKNMLPETETAVTSNENFDKADHLSQKIDEETKAPNKMHSFLIAFQQFNAVKEKLKQESNSIADSSATLKTDTNRSYACAFCDKTFTNKKSFLNHKKSERKKRNSMLTLNETNFEQVIINFIRSIRHATDTSKSNAKLNFNRLKQDPSFDLRTVINDTSSNNLKFFNKNEEAYFPSLCENQTPFECDIKPCDHLTDFNKHADQKRIPLNQNILPY